MFYGNRTKVMLVSAIVLAVLASWMAYSWVQKRAGQQVSEMEIATKPVVVATVEIPQGQEIEVAHLKIINWPAELAPEGSFEKTEEVAGKVATRTIYPEDIITAKRFAENPDGNHLAALIAKNKRAVTVRVDDVIGVGGFLLPGNRVDVIGAKRIPGSTSVRTRTVIKDVVVLAVDQEINAEENKPKVVRAVTLEMYPSSALKVVKASNEGKIHLLLRNPADKLVLAKPRKHKRTKKVYRPGDITVIRGTDVSRIKPKS